MRRLGIESRLDGVEVGGRVIRIQALPIGIAPDRFLNLLGSQDVCRNISELRRRYEGRKILLSVDRLDYTKGLPERLQTFSRLLESSSELRGRVVLIQVAVPSREGIDMYQDLRNEVNRMISEINGKFGSADWTPVVYINRNISRAELVALYQFSDVGWISPLRDGMNLVAKEYVACRPEGDGVLVLSEFAGAAAEMGEALLINPYDEERTVAMLERALEMPERERRARMRALHQRVLRNNVFSWAERFLSELAHAAESRAAGGIEEPPALDVNAMISAYRAARKRILIFDYDGTLVPFAPKPEMAAPTPGLIGDLEQLLSDRANLVALVSGRSPEDLELWFGNLRELALAAEHGAIWKAPDGSDWQNARAGVTDWKTSLRPILEHFVDRTPGSFVEEKHNALVWHYRTAEPEFGEWLANELVAMLEGMLADTDLRPLHGSKIVEIKPLWANKGEVFERLLSWFPDPEFVLAIGDDRTDEDLFSRIASNGWTVHVGRGPSKASWRLQGVPAVRDILRTLSRTAGSGQEIAPGMSRGST
jgi:trehalose 6-phosphate synthase/phosphatase